MFESGSNIAILCQNDAPVKTLTGLCQVVCSVIGTHICCGRRNVGILLQKESRPLLAVFVLCHRNAAQECLIM